MEEQKNYTIAEEFKLPSNGEIYSPKIEPYVKLRSMTVREEMKRTNPQNLTVHKNLCEIIDACLLTKLPISCYDMCIGDYEYLIHKLRVTTYGPEYKTMVGCPKCESIYEEILNLDELKEKKWTLEDFRSCFNITLPVSKAKVELYLQTPRLLDTIEMKVREFKKENPDAVGDMRDFITMQETVHLVNGNKLGYVELENFLSALSARDGQFILRKIQKANKMIGLDTGVDITCKKCGADIKTSFRFGPEFFRPTNDD